MRGVAACARRPWLVIMVAGVLCTSAIAYTVRHIAIDTNSSNLIAEDVAWRKREMVFDAAFPQRADLIAIVVDAATPERAEQATAVLAQRLSSQIELFRAVSRPDGGAFFDRAGPLFESIADLSQTTQRLIAAQPLLGSLAQDPTVRGLMDALALLVEGVQADPTRFDELAQPLGAFADAFDGFVGGAAPAFSWRTLMTDMLPGRASCGASSLCSRCSTITRCSPVDAPARRFVKPHMTLDSMPIR